MANQDTSKNIPPLLLPQSVMGYEKYMQEKWSKPLPPEYRKPAKAVKEVELSNTSLVDILNPKKNKYFREMYNLALITLQRSKEINFLLKKIPILESNSSLDPWIARILIAELLWGKQYLKSGAKEVETIKYFEEELREAFTEVTAIIKNPLDQRKLKFPTYVRINTLSISIENCLCAFFKEGWNLLPRCESYSDHLQIIANLRDKNFIKDYHISELLVFPPETIFYDHPGYLRGKFLLQDKGSCLSSFLLNPRQDSVVLDLCAAPGLKTNHLANIMNNTGLIIANDIHPLRVDAMNKLLKLTDVKNTKCYENDFLNLKTIDEDVKYILIDPTCTNSGIFFGKSRTPLKARLQRYQFVLSMMLRHTLQNYPNVKRVVYTTCSLFPEECEVIIDDALKDVGDSYTLLDVREMLWNEWESLGLPEHMCGNKCLRIVPEIDLCYGYFIAVFERNYEVPVPPYIKRYRKPTQDERGKVDNDQKRDPISGRLIKTKVNEHNLGSTECPTPVIPTVNRITNKQRKQMKYFIFKEKMRKRNELRAQLMSSAEHIALGKNKPITTQGIYETTHNQLYP